MQPHLLNFLENHDEQRLASDFFLANGEAGIPAMTVAATINTNPVMIYFGQELGERGMDNEGFSGVDGRTTIFDYWSLSTVRDWRNGGKFDGAHLSPEALRLRNFYAKLLNICKSEPAIAQGLFFDLMYVNRNNEDFDPNRQYAYIRSVEGQTLLICVNFDSKPVTVGVQIPYHAFDYLKMSACENCTVVDLLTDEPLQVDLQPNEKVIFDLEPCGVRIWQVQSDK
jgi:hypothetical protein